MTNLLGGSQIAGTIQPWSLKKWGCLVWGSYDNDQKYVSLIKNKNKKQPKELFTSFNLESVSSERVNVDSVNDQRYNPYCVCVCECVSACMHTCIQSLLCVLNTLCVYNPHRLCNPFCICLHVFVCVWAPYICVFVHVFLCVCVMVHVSVCAASRWTLATRILLLPTQSSGRKNKVTFILNTCPYSWGLFSIVGFRKTHIVRLWIYFNSSKFTIETNSISQLEDEEGGTDPTGL